MASFVAIDVETAADQCTICQIGVVYFYNGEVEWRWSSLVNPECRFKRQNIEVHGITGRMVREAPTWPAVFDCIASSIDGQTIVSHTDYDWRSLNEAANRYDLRLPSLAWIDSYELARSVWPEIGSHGLNVLTDRFRIEHKHHDALSDAEACGRVVLQALRETGSSLLDIGKPTLRHQTLTEWTSPWPHEDDCPRQGARDGPLFGFSAILSGTFESGKRRLSDWAARLGMDVVKSLGKKRQNAIVVLGHRDLEDFETEKSAKHLAAEEAIAEGRDVWIMTEVQFERLLEEYS